MTTDGIRNQCPESHATQVSRQRGGPQRILGGPEQGPALPVTVVIAAFNREQTIGRALDSVRAQCEVPAEVLVVDDGSTDRTVEVARAMGARVIALPENGGAAAARNAGIDAATQPWIAFLDSDDEWVATHLDTLWPHTREFELVAGTMTTVHDESGHRMRTGARRPRRLESPAALVFPDNAIPLGSVLVSRRILREVGGFDSRLRYSEDLDLWLRVLERVNGLVIPEPVLLYHVHGGQKTARRADARTAQWALLERYREAQWWSSLAFDRRVALNRCELDILAGDRRRAVRRLLRGIVREPRVYLPVVPVLAAQSVGPRLPARMRSLLERPAAASGGGSDSDH